jgi:hypothetical protein
VTQTHPINEAFEDDESAHAVAHQKQFAMRPDEGLQRSDEVLTFNLEFVVRADPARAITPQQYVELRKIWILAQEFGEKTPGRDVVAQYPVDEYNRISVGLLLEEPDERAWLVRSGSAFLLSSKHRLCSLSFSFSDTLRLQRLSADSLSAPQCWRIFTQARKLSIKGRWDIASSKS